MDHASQNTRERAGASETLADRFATYKTLREAGPVHRLSEIEDFPLATDLGPLGHARDRTFLCVARDEVELVLRDSDVFPRLPNPLSNTVGRSWVDPASHQRVRRLTGHAFRPKVLERWRTEYIADLANGLIDRFIHGGRADLNRDFSFELPIQVISRILGLPGEEYAAFRESSMDLMGLGTDPDRALAALQSLKARVDAAVDARRGETRDDLISDLVTVDIDGERMSKEDVFDAVLLLIVAGNETTTRGLGNLMSALLTHRDELHALLEDLSLVPQAVEEGLRWDPPAHTATPRVATRPIDLGGHGLQEGDAVLVSLASANRDDRYYEDPERFWIGRPKPHPHLTFAGGQHFCLGHHLARMELEISVRALLDRLTNLRIDHDANPQSVGRAGGREIGNLPVLFDAGEPLAEIRA